jgi:superoxide dismutase, Cu-Zn family
VTYPQGQATVFTPPAVEGTEANGLALDNRNRIYVARGTNSRVDVYDLTTRQRVGRFTTPPGSFVNDLTVDRRTGDVYATDSFLPAIYRISGAQVAAGTGTPQTIPTAPEVTTAPVGTNPPKPFNANGIRFTPDGRYLLFDDLNDAALYRMTVPPANAPAQRQITRVAVTGGSLGDADGLEFDGRTLYVVDNGGERILNLSLSNDWTRATITKATTSPLYRTPTSAALTPDGRLLVSQAELFDTNGPPYAVTSQPRP